MNILEWMQGAFTSKWTFLLALNVFLLIVGSLMDIFSALIVVVPLIVPIAEGYGVNLVHLGIIFLTNLEIGYSTPPVGLNLFISSFRFERPVLDLYRASLPFLGILLIALALITYVPALSLMLGGMLGSGAAAP
jgi:TRAP-type C4-dicarboxylate transport system permease large subunit